MILSSIIFIFISYPTVIRFLSPDPPIYRGTGLSASNTGVPKVLECEVCGNPAPSSYTWLHRGALPRDGMTLEGNKLKIDTVHEGDFGVFTCKVSNRIDNRDYTSSFDIRLIAQGKFHCVLIYLSARLHAEIIASLRLFSIKFFFRISPTKHWS